MPVESEKNDALTKLLEHLPSLKKIVLHIPQTHPHDLPLKTSHTPLQTLIQILIKKHPLSDMSARIIFRTFSIVVL